MTRKEEFIKPRNARPRQEKSNNIERCGKRVVDELNGQIMTI